MKYALAPIQVFETGDRVLCSQGTATVIHDEMENFATDHGFYQNPLSGDGFILQLLLRDAHGDSLMRSGVLMRLDKPTAQHPNIEEDFVEGREHLTLLDK
jgi:hypothetical protein